MTNDTDEDTRDTTGIIDTTRTPPLSERYTHTMTNDSDPDTENDTTTARSTTVSLSDSAVDAIGILGLTALGYIAFENGNLTMAQMAMGGIAALTGIKIYGRNR